MTILLLLLAVVGMKRDIEHKDEMVAALIDSEVNRIQSMSAVAFSSNDTTVKKHTDSVILALLPNAYELRGTIRAKSGFFAPYVKCNASVDTLIQKIIYYGNKK